MGRKTMTFKITPAVADKIVDYRHAQRILANTPPDLNGGPNAEYLAQHVNLGNALRSLLHLALPAHVDDWEWCADGWWRFRLHDDDTRHGVQLSCRAAILPAADLEHELHRLHKKATALGVLAGVCQGTYLLDD